MSEGRFAAARRDTAPISILAFIAFCRASVAVLRFRDLLLVSRETPPDALAPGFVESCAESVDLPVGSGSWSTFLEVWPAAALGFVFFGVFVASALRAVRVRPASLEVVESFALGADDMD